MTWHSKSKVVPGPTPSQTAGPFFHIGFQHLCRDSVIASRMGGRGVTVRGQIVDGDGAAVPDAAVEIWQAGEDGAHGADTSGFCRIHTDASGEFSFTTVRPGPIRGPDGATQAPHLAMLVFMRGLLKPVLTRMYFPDDARNDADPVLSHCVPAERRHTLIAREESADVMRWTIVLQGTNETVFFDAE
jgi:protocatechuate 3,4-dioxygenase alpha subunit